MNGNTTSLKGSNGFEGSPKGVFEAVFGRSLTSLWCLSSVGDGQYNGCSCQSEHLSFWMVFSMLLKFASDKDLLKFDGSGGFLAKKEQKEGQLGWFIFPC